MKKIFMLAASAFILYADIANACSCLPRQPEAYFESANVVFAGRVVDVIEPGRRLGRYNPNVTNRRVRFEVSEVWKGNKARQIVLTTSESSASCGFNFIEGENYLVYAARSEGRLTTNLCSGTKPLSQAQEDLLMLGKKESPRDTVSFETAQKGFYSGIDEPFETVIKDRDTWETFWANLHSIQFPSPSLPDIDFSKNMVIGVGMGSRSSGGYSAEIKNIIVEDGKLAVNLVEFQPGSNCLVTMAITQPYHLVVLESSDLPIQVNRQVESIGCQ